MKHISSFVEKLQNAFPYKSATTLVIGGPTASGKTGLSIKVAKALKEKGKIAEIISADSRQIYKNLEAFSAAATLEEQEGFKHYFVGTESPSEPKSVQWFQENAEVLINAILAKGHVPIIVGCGGFWMQSLLFEQDYPKVLENKALRAELEVLNLKELQVKLKQLDPKRYETVDQNNPRRVMRSIEIATELGHVPEMNFSTNKKLKALFVYLKPDKEVNKDNIVKGVGKRFENGLLEELEALRKTFTQSQFFQLGSAAKFVNEYWEGSLDTEGLMEKTINEETHHAKKQRTFFNKMFKNYEGPKGKIETGGEREIKRIISRLKF